MEGITQITGKHTPQEVKEETARRTKVDKWKDERWWTEFLDARATFLKSKDIPTSVDEHKQLERAFGEWVKESKFWWGGDWAYSEDLAVWHIKRYLKGRKKPGKSATSTLKEHDFPADPSKLGQSSLAPTPQQRFFDPVLDKFRQI